MNTLLIGKGGSGKTTAACTGRKPLFLIDVDKKAHEMINLKPLIDSGELIIYDIKSKLIEDNLAWRALNPDKPMKIQPTGYVEIIEVINQVLEGDIAQDCNTIVLDSLTRLAEHLKRLLIFHRGKGKFGKKVDADMNWPSWGSYLANLEELFSALMDFGDKDFICIAHEKEMVERDPITEVEIIKGYYPLIDGQMREKLPTFFNEVYFMNRVFKKAEKKNIYQFRTAGNKYCARTSLVLDESVDADLSKIFGN